MKSDPFISIVIPSYNSRKTIIQCLNSVLNQSYRNIEEVIIIDSSVDGIDNIIRPTYPSMRPIHYFYRKNAETWLNCIVKTDHAVVEVMS